MTWASVVRITVVALVVLAGCSAPGTAPASTATQQSSLTSTERGGSDAVGMTTPTTDPTPETPTTARREEHPDPPTTLRNATVTQVVRDFDEVRIHNVLREHYRDFSVGAYGTNTARVLNRSDDGVYVRVTTSYSYQYESGYADGLTARSVYFANETVIRRVNGTELKLLDGPRDE
jgi:hypothetical protein